MAAMSMTDGFYVDPLDVKPSDLVVVRKGNVVSRYIATRVVARDDGQVDVEVLADPENGEVER
jgi:hypothetical protein